MAEELDPVVAGRLPRILREDSRRTSRVPDHLSMALLRPAPTLMYASSSRIPKQTLLYILEYTLFSHTHDSSPLLQNSDAIKQLDTSDLSTSQLDSSLVAA